MRKGGMSGTVKALGRANPESAFPIDGVMQT
jgi:hypothetical protein